MTVEGAEAAVVGGIGAANESSKGARSTVDGLAGTTPARRKVAAVEAADIAEGKGAGKAAGVKAWGWSARDAWSGAGEVASGRPSRARCR